MSSVLWSLAIRTMMPRRWSKNTRLSWQVAHIQTKMQRLRKTRCVAWHKEGLSRRKWFDWPGTSKTWSIVTLRGTQSLWEKRRLTISTLQSTPSWPSTSARVTTAFWASTERWPRRLFSVTQHGTKWESKSKTWSKIILTSLAIQNFHSRSKKLQRSFMKLSCKT